MFTEVRHWNLSWARWIHASPSHPVSLRHILIRSSHTYLCLPSVSLQVSLPTFHAFLIISMHAICITHLICPNNIRDYETPPFAVLSSLLFPFFRSKYAQNLPASWKCNPHGARYSVHERVGLCTTRPTELQRQTLYKQLQLYLRRYALLLEHDTPSFPGRYVSVVTAVTRPWMQSQCPWSRDLKPRAANYFTFKTVTQHFKLCTPFCSFNLKSRTVTIRTSRFNNQ
jgi:hypothetical protein